MHYPKTIPARLNKIITLQQEIAIEDGQGGFNKEWHDVKSIWAEIIPIKMLSLAQMENFVAGKLIAKTIHRITIRYMPGLSTEMRIKFKTRIFSIINIINLEEKNILLEIVVEEKEE